MLGPTEDAVTVNVAELLLKMVRGMLTNTRKVAPLSPEDRLRGSCGLPEVAPEMFAVFFCHW